MFRDLGSIIKEFPDRYRVLGIRAMDTRGISPRVVVHIAEYPPEASLSPILDITCVKAVDYSIRPMHPNIIEGGPLIEFHEEHPRLNPSLQAIPGGDGEQFDPPVKFTILILNQSYIIAERFLIRAEKPEDAIGERDLG